MPEDAALLRRYADTRAEDAFAELVRRHVDAVYSSARRRVGGDTHLAEDVTQQVFVALARRASAVARHPALGSWLYVATRHAAANTVRTERRRKAREQEAATMQESTSESSTAADWSRVAPLIDAAIDRLAERDRTAVLLRFIESRSFAEIGTALHLSEDAARMRVDRALDKLRVSLARRGVASTSAALGLALANHAVAAAPAGLAASTTLAAASAATTGAASVSLLQLMTSAKITTSAVGIALLFASFGAATHEIHRAGNATAALLTARANDSALAVRLHALNDQAVAAEREAAQLSQQLRDAEAAAADSARRAAAAAAATAKAAAWNPTAEGRAFMVRHPEVRQALIDWFDANTNYRYSAFYEAMGFTPAQIAEFQALQRRGSFGRSLVPGMPYLQFEPGPPSSWKDTDARMRQLLGPDGYRKYIAFSRSISARELGAQVATALSFTPTPLTANQFDQLTQAIGDAHAITMTSTGPQVDWAIVSANASKILSPEQRPLLDAVRAQAEFNQAYSNAAMTLRRPAPVSPAPHSP